LGSSSILVKIVGATISVDACDIFFSRFGSEGSEFLDFKGLDCLMFSIL